MSDQPTVVFECAERGFCTTEVLQAAEIRGEMPPFLAGWRRRRAAARAAAAAGLAPTAEAVEEAMNEFRYARDLISGEECERWLGRRGLTFGDLENHCTRWLQAAMIPLADEAGEGREEEGELRVDLLLSNAFGRWARALAWRTAAAAEVGAPMKEAESLADAWARIEEAYTAAMAECASEDRRRRLLAGQRLALTRVGFDRAEFDSESAAREAVLCAREDGLPLREVAVANGFPCESREGFLADLPPDWRERLTSAPAGELLVVPESEGLHVVLAVAGRIDPIAEEPAVRARLDELLQDQRRRELEARHIRWLLEPEVGS